MEEPRRLGGRYELGSVLGRGGMAEVYLAHDTRLGRTVAVKTLRVDLARDPSFQARFRREAQSAASLNHPAIVAVYDTGEDMVYDAGGPAGEQGGVSIPYIVMEYVDGSTLRELLHSGRKLLPERAMEMCVGILQALEYSHRSGIVHRDIKPANVMLTTTGQVKVMDFGIARAMGDSGVTMTQTSSVIGTAQYLSPEQAKGESVDARSDLYSTGCLIYELLTNRPPFVGDSPVAVAYQHVREEPQPPSAFDAEVAPAMDAIVLRALVKDPDYRYQSADEMRADIEACLDGQPVAASSAMAAGGFGYGDDQATTAMRAQNPQTSMLPPVDGENEGGFYGDGHGRPRRSKLSVGLLVLAGILVLVGAILIGKELLGTEQEGPVKVPRLAGKSVEDAQAYAESRNFKVKKDDTAYCDQKKGLVCSTEPGEGETIQAGHMVMLTTSKGPKPVVVPNVQDDPYSTAAQQLKEKGFKVVRKTEESGKPPNTVLRQTPKGNSQAKKGSTVTLTVAKQARKPVPDVTDKPYDEAKKALEDAGFKNVVQDQKDDDSKPADTVIEQDPAADTRAATGKQITLTVAKGKDDQPVSVPNVTNKTVADARKELEGAGFVVGDINGAGPDENNATVVNTDPGADSPAKKGDKININARPGKPGGDDGGDDGPPIPFGGTFGDP